MLRFVLIFLTAGAGYVFGYPKIDVAPPIQPCLAPLQWEGRAVRYNHNTGRNTRAAVSYDAQNQRVRILQQHKKHTPCQKFFEYIYLYQSGLMFQIDQKTKQCSKNVLTEEWDPIDIPSNSTFGIDQKTKQCSKNVLTEEWDPIDIPSNSTFEDQYFIGGPGDMVEVQEWSDRKPARKHETWVGVYTLKDCYPVQETYTRNSSVTTSTRFFDIQLGITDPSVFVPPPTCQSASSQEMEQKGC